MQNIFQLRQNFKNITSSCFTKKQLTLKQDYYLIRSNKDSTRTGVQITSGCFLDLGVHWGVPIPIPLWMHGICEIKFTIRTNPVKDFIIKIIGRQVIWVLYIINMWGIYNRCIICVYMYTHTHKCLLCKIHFREEYALKQGEIILRLYHKLLPYFSQTISNNPQV